MYRKAYRRKWLSWRRKRSFKRKSSNNYLSKDYGGWKDERGKYSQKGHFDWLTYYRKHK